MLNAIKYAARHPMVTVPQQRYLTAAQATAEPAIIMAVREFVDERMSTDAYQGGSTEPQDHHVARGSRASPPVRAV